MSHEDLPLFAELAQPVTPQVTMVCDDVLAWAEKTPPIGAHCLLADPPYSLGDGRTGFMNKRWDNDIAFKPDTWKALAQHLLPGAFGMCFASSRGWHRLACAIEDAGLIIHPSIFMLGYLTGQGFPKASRIDSQIDAAAGAEREVIHYDRYRDGHDRQYSGPYDTYSGQHSANGNLTTAPATPLAKVWEQHRYGLQALKPSLEPIIVWQKPYQGKPVDSITQTGAGALWIEGGRITSPVLDSERRTSATGDSRLFSMLGRTTGERHHPSGRWPANFCLLHTDQCIRVGERQVKGAGWADSDIPRSPETHDLYESGSFQHCTSAHYTDANGHETVAAWQCAPQCPVALLDQQAGERKPPWGKEKSQATAPTMFMATPRPLDNGKYQDGSNASRFFHVSDWSLDVAERLAQADPVYYSAKASRRERSSGLPSGERNNHPCCKPLKLCQWLATLLLPPAAYCPRRLLIPFSGSGSEGIGAILAGWEEVVMVDSDPNYVDIARQRIAYWQQGKL